MSLLLPEEAELERLEKELFTLLDTIADKELELETARVNLARFRTRYQSTIVPLYAELDQLDAVIARYEAGENPDDIEAQKRAEEAELKAKESAREVDADKEHEKTAEPRKEPTLEVKQEFRKGAKLMHPDLATDESEKARRHTFMARLNQAYEQCDMVAIQRIIKEFGEDPESIKGDDIGARMVKVIRKIAQIRRRLDDITKKIDHIRSDEYFILMTKVEEADADGGDSLADLHATLMQQISERKIVIEEWRQRMDRV